MTETTSPSNRNSGRRDLTPDRLGSNYFKLFGASTISNVGDGIALIAYPWLASALTRSPLMIALVAVVQRLPWLLFSLPAGVVTDRMDRRRLMVGANIVRTVLTGLVALLVLNRTNVLPAVDVVTDPDAIITTNLGLYLIVLIATLFIGTAEVLYDNAAQTFMPSIVHSSQLEKANGRLWSIEQVANTFIGPPLGALLLVAAFSLPFFVDAATFGISAALVALIPSTSRSTSHDTPARKHWRTELSEGFRWLWNHELLRPLAIILGLLNGIMMMTLSILVLYAQEVLNTSATEFALLGTGGALGGVIGGWTASRISSRIGAGPSLWLTLLGAATTTAVIGLTSWWMIAWLMFAIMSMVGVLWNVITVSLRQTIIPDHLLGRVNSVYRFFGWGMMPIGSLLGGVIVVAAEVFDSREIALRLPWLIAAGLYVLLLVFAAPKLTTERIEAARSAATADDH